MAIQRFATSSIGDEILRKDFRNLVCDKLLDGVKSDKFYEKFIFDLDFNNLYGSVQTLHMPHHSFQWASTELCTELQQYYFVKSVQIAKKLECDTWESFTTTKNKMNDGEKEEVFLEIDFKYPKKHHINHSDFPLAPNNFCIQNSDLSTKASELLNDLNPNKKHIKVKN